jgi:hypothetical protein
MNICHHKADHAKGGLRMKRMLIKSLLASLALGALLSGCATTIDYPGYHYRGYVGPGEIEYHYSNRY